MLWISSKNINMQNIRTREYHLHATKFKVYIYIGTHKIALIWRKRCISNCPSQTFGKNIFLNFPPFINIVYSNVAPLQQMIKIYRN